MIVQRKIGYGPGFFRGIRYQRGNGFYRGVRYQQGNGFFGNLLTKAVFPLLKYVGKQGVRTALAIGEEAARNPSHSLKDIAKRKFADAGLQALEDGVKKVKSIVHSGDGIKSYKKPVIQVNKSNYPKGKSSFSRKKVITKSLKPSKPRKGKKTIKRTRKSKSSFLFV